MRQFRGIGLHRKKIIMSYLHVRFNSPISRSSAILDRNNPAVMGLGIFLLLRSTNKRWRQTRKPIFERIILRFCNYFMVKSSFILFLLILAFSSIFCTKRLAVPSNSFKGPVNKCTQDFFKENYEWQTCYCWWSDPLCIVPMKTSLLLQSPPLFTYTFILLLCYSYITLHIKIFVLCSNK